MIKIFLDDVREPSDIGWNADDPDLVICRSHAEFTSQMFKHQFDIEAIAFDHDLGVDANGKLLPDGYDSIKWFGNFWMNVNPYKPLPKLSCHSMNPDGKKNIEMYIKNLKRHIS